METGPEEVPPLGEDSCWIPMPLCATEPGSACRTLKDISDGLTAISSS